MQNRPYGLSSSLDSVFRVATKNPTDLASSLVPTYGQAGRQASRQTSIHAHADTHTCIGSVASIK